VKKKKERGGGGGGKPVSGSGRSLLPLSRASAAVEVVRRLSVFSTDEQTGRAKKKKAKVDEEEKLLAPPNGRSEEARALVQTSVDGLRGPVVRRESRSTQARVSERGEGRHTSMVFSLEDVRACVLAVFAFKRPLPR
jgi:hypothetical protein